jgi:hypothetical protein
LKIQLLEKLIKNFGGLKTDFQFNKQMMAKMYGNKFKNLKIQEIILILEDIKK